MFPQLQIQAPDIGRALLQGQGIQQSRLAQLAQQQAIDDAAQFRTGARDLLPQLATAEGSARQSVLARLAGLGDRGLSMALPMIDADRQTERQRQRPLTAEEATALGLRPGTVATTDGLGRLTPVQTPDTMSDGRVAQELRLRGAGREPRITWTDVKDENGNIIGQRSSTGQYNPLPQQPNMFGGGAQGMALQFITRHAEAAQAGTLTPDLQRQFDSAVTLYQQPRTQYDPATGQMVTITPPLPAFMQRPAQSAPAQPQAEQPAAPQPQAQSPAQPAAPQQPQGQPGAPIGQTGMVAIPPSGGVSVQQVNPSRSGAPTANDQSRLRNIEVEAQGVRDALATFRELRANASPQERAAAAAGMPTALSTAWSNAALLAKGEALYNLGVLNGPDLTIIQRTLSDPATIRGLFTGQATTEAQIAQIERLLDQRLEVARRQYGGQQHPAQGAPSMRFNPATGMAEPITGGR